MLSRIFKTEERLRILRYISVRHAVSVNQVSSETGISKGLVSRYLNMLVNEGFFEKSGRQFVLIDNASSRAVKCLLNIDLVAGTVTLPLWAAGIGMYGSWKDGTNTTESDLDIWVYVKEYSPDLEIRLAKLEKKISQATGCETNILLLTDAKLKQLENTDQPFYRNLMKSSMTLGGVSIDQN